MLNQITDKLCTVTIIYYNDESLELEHEIKQFSRHNNGRVVIPDSYKKNKSIIAVCEGEINILNKIGERILPVAQVAI
jgi:uncharacterized protein (TIGR02922 family)